MQKYVFFRAIVNLQHSYFFCSECECNEDGSVDERCDDEGKCSCKPNVIGDKCENCEENHFRNQSGQCEGL